MVVKLLNERVSQKEIACRLKISITTVSRWSRLFTFDKKIIHKLI
jgi:Trp operon repressor